MVVFLPYFQKKPNTIVTRCLGTDYTAKFSYLPTDGTCGGVLHACRGSGYQFNDVVIKKYSLNYGVR
jgi:hypothetical protein